MIAASVEPEAEVTPVPFGGDALQTLAVIQGVQQQAIEMMIEGFGDFVGQRMFAQCEQRLFGMVIGFGVEDVVDLGLKFLFGLLTSLGSYILN